MPKQKPKNSSLLKLLNLILTCNNFTFCGEHFLQILGTAMGTKAAPNYAINFMTFFERLYVYIYKLSLYFWKRYIDDIFMIWTHTRTQLDEFITYLNSCHKTIKFTTEISLKDLMRPRRRGRNRLVVYDSAPCRREVAAAAGYQSSTFR